MKRTIFLALAAACSCFAKPATLVYKNSFDSPAALNDWVMEGPGIAKIDAGRLLIYSKWQLELKKLDGQIPLIEPGGEKYYPFIEQWVKEREPGNLPKYRTRKWKPGKFAGGHIQFWNKQVHPENFMIRIKFQAANPYPLHMVTFCGRGINGENIFDPKLSPRFGLAAQYMFGDIRNYRISYWSGTRGTSNMRRAPGRKLTAKESGDIPHYALDREVQLEIIRWNGRVVFKCDGETLVDWTDDDPFGDGFFSLRLMAAAKGWYDDYEVYELHEDPFANAVCGAEVGVSREQRIEWWQDARYGLFIHFGLYAIPAGVWKGKEIPGLGEWIQMTAQIPNREYSALTGQFNPQGFDADEWVLLAKAGGMKYMVITSKHHDGFALFHSAYSDFDIENTPFERDLIKELAEACRRHGMKLGFYYSHRQDWHEEDAAMMAKEFDGHFGKPKSEVQPNFDRYMEEKALPQIKELLTQYGEVALIWYDTPFDLTMEQSQRFVDAVRKYQPNCIVNGRVGYELGDYAGLGDNEMPAFRASKPLEMVATMNRSWGFKVNDHAWKSSRELLLSLISCAASGVNYMLNIGPMADGHIPWPSMEIMAEIGEWLQLNGDAIYGTEASPFPSSFPWGYVTGRENRLYLHVVDKPATGEIVLKGLKNPVRAARLLASGASLPLSKKGNVIRIVLPKGVDFGSVTVVEVDVEGMPEAEQIMQPFASNGQIALPARLGRIQPGSEGVLSFRNGGATENWNPGTGSLEWRFRVDAPGEYEVFAYVSRHWSWRFPEEMKCSLVHDEQELSHIPFNRMEMLDNVSKHSYPEFRCFLGCFTLNEAGWNSLSMKMDELGSYRKVSAAGEDLGRRDVNNIRMMKLLLVPRSN